MAVKKMSQNGFLTEGSRPAFKEKRDINSDDVFGSCKERNP